MAQLPLAISLMMGEKPDYMTYEVVKEQLENRDEPHPEAYRYAQGEQATCTSDHDPSMDRTTEVVFNYKQPYNYHQTTYYFSLN